MAPISSTLAAWELGLRLREARDLVGMTGTDAAKTIGITQNHMSNVEHGRRKISEDKLVKLGAAYELSKDEQHELLALRKAAEGKGWWWRYSGLFPAELLRFLGYEDGAEEVTSYENVLISGLLQTERYARAIHQGDGANLRMSEVDRRVEVRLRRQERLTGNNPLRATIIMGEAALRQQVGGTEVLAEQLRHLLDLTEQHSDNLEMRIVPFTAGSYGAMGSSTFHVLTFPSPRLPRVAWQETAVSMDLIEDQHQVHQYNASFAEALSCTLDREGSAGLVRDTLKDLT